MNEETTNVLDQALANVLIQASEGIEKASEFVLAEIPDVAAQALLWYGTYHFLMFLLGLALIPGFYQVYKKIYLFVKSIDDEEHRVLAYIICGMVGGILVIPLSVLYCLDLINLTWLKIWIAPKLWMIEYAASIVK